MLGQALSILGEKYNVIILAGGRGTRMGEQSEYIPKALSQIGKKRAIDYIIERHLTVAHKFIIGTGSHADILESYVKGRFSPLEIEFSREDKTYNNAISLLYCLDHADIRYGTIVTFCDLLPLGKPVIENDTVLVASAETRGVVGDFRHIVITEDGPAKKSKIFLEDPPIKPTSISRGILGYYVFGDTKLLKSVAYSTQHPVDITWNYLLDYMRSIHVDFRDAGTVYEFGNSNDLEEVRKKWEDA